MSPHIFRAYDIRGLVKYFPHETAEKIGKAFGTYIIRRLKKEGIKRSNPKIVVGRDNRFSSDELKAFFIEGLLSSGCQVTDIGLTITPLMHFSVIKKNFDGGVIVTASHNDKRYNGFRFDYKNGLPIYNEAIQKIREIAENGDFIRGIGDVDYADFFDDYLEDIKKRITIKKPLRVVIDCGNGATARFSPILFESVGFKVSKLFCNLDGSFPYHDPDPEESLNLTFLSKVVVETNADVGVSFDTDGDRFGVLDETGRKYENDQILVLLAKDILKRNPGAKVIFDIKSSMILPAQIKKYGGRPILFRTGHPYYRVEMEKDPQILLGGEVSSHTFIKDNYYGFDDGLFAALRTLQIISHEGKPLSKLFSDLPKTFHTEELKLPCPDDKKFALVEKIKTYFSKYYKTVEIDGVRIIFSKDSWGLIRASNTEPAISVRFEAKKQADIEKSIKLVLKRLKKYPDVDISFLEVESKKERLPL